MDFIRSALGMVSWRFLPGSPALGIEYTKSMARGAKRNLLNVKTQLKQSNRLGCQTPASVISHPGKYPIQFFNMIPTTRRQPCLKAYTIIESLVVIAILTVITFVLLALFKYEKDESPKKGKASHAPLTAPADPSPAPTIEDKEK